MNGLKRISQIHIGERSRKDFGDLQSLMQSIEKLGLLHPVALDSRDNLIAGHRRIEAFKQLGRKEIPFVPITTIDDALKHLEAERDENTERKPYNPTEALALAKRLEPFERKAAKERQAKAGGKGNKKNGSEKFSGPLGNASDKVASAVGLSRPTLRKIEKVVDLAKENPERYGDFVQQLDATGKVDSVFKAATRKKVEELGPIPSEGAKADPERRWFKALHDLYVLINSTRAHGGLTVLMAKWKDRSPYLAELKRVAAELQEWIAILEGEQHAKARAGDVAGSLSRSNQGSR